MLALELALHLRLGSLITQAEMRLAIAALPWLSVLLSLTVRVGAYPSLFVGGVSNTCTDAPLQSYSDHKWPVPDAWVVALHGPVHLHAGAGLMPTHAMPPDRATAFQLTDVDGRTVAPTAQLCPGATYHLQARPHRGRECAGNRAGRHCRQPGCSLARVPRALLGEDHRGCAARQQQRRAATRMRALWAVGASLTQTAATQRARGKPDPPPPPSGQVTWGGGARRAYLVSSTVGRLSASAQDNDWMNW